MKSVAMIMAVPVVNIGARQEGVEHIRVSHLKKKKQT